MLDIQFQVSLRNRNDKKTVEFLEKNGYKPERLNSQLFIPVENDEMFWKWFDLNWEESV